MITKAATAFLSRCFHNDEPRVIQPFFDEKYDIEGITYKFTQEVLDDMVQTGRVRITGQDEKRVNLVGLYIE